MKSYLDNYQKCGFQKYGIFLGGRIVFVYRFIAGSVIEFLICGLK